MDDADVVIIEPDAEDGNLKFFILLFVDGHKLICHHFLEDFVKIDIKVLEPLPEPAPEPEVVAIEEAEVNNGTVEESEPKVNFPYITWSVWIEDV